MFPERLVVECINAGCPERGIVLDPFMGSGTTAVVARKFNRQYVGFEINPGYMEIAESKLTSRLKSLT
jgi:site-specific DNA-methyltransferase (adenine-specific)